MNVIYIYVIGILLLLVILFILYLLRKIRNLEKNIDEFYSEAYSQRFPCTKDQWISLQTKVTNQEKEIELLKGYILDLKKSTKENQLTVIDEDINNSNEKDLDVQQGDYSERNDDEKPCEILFDLDNNSSQGKVIEYSYIKVIDGGKLVTCSTNDTAHYRYWKENNIIKFEFSSKKTPKAINNRASLIEPFCDIDSNSISPDAAHSILNVTPGELYEDLTVKQKVLIKYY